MFGECPHCNPELNKLEWLHEALIHYRNQQNLGIMNWPNWRQETLIIAFDEVQKMDNEAQTDFRDHGKPGAAHG